MQIRLFKWEPPTRPCRFCLSLQNDSVFADFNIDDDGRVFVVRISYDGYGCCREPVVGRMTPQESAALLAMVEQDALEPAVPLLRAYFRENQEVLWSDALAEHGLV